MNNTERDHLNTALFAFADRFEDDIASLRANGAAVEVSQSGVHVHLPDHIRASDLRLKSTMLVNAMVGLNTKSE